VLVAGFTSPLAGEVVDASEPRELGLSDRYMINGLHGSEVFMGHILLRLSAYPGLQAALPGFDGTKLQALLRSPQTSPALFGRAATRRPG